MGDNKVQTPSLLKATVQDFELGEVSSTTQTTLTDETKVLRKLDLMYGPNSPLTLYPRLLLNNTQRPQTPTLHNV